jgi:hypothetical protein
LFVFLSFCSFFYGEFAVFAQTNQPESKLQEANFAIGQAFKAILDAEKAGENVTALMVQLNFAEGILAQAENSYRTGDSDTAAAQADSVLPIAQEITTTAQEAKRTALVSDQNVSWSTITLTVIGAIVFVLVLFLIWSRFKRNYIKSPSEAKTKVVSQ